MISNQNKKKNVSLFIASAFLLLSLFDGWQYGFFTILRFVVFSSAVYVAYLAYQYQKEGWVWFLGAIAVLFNPFIPIYLTRDVWVAIDFVTAILLLSTIYTLQLNEKK